MNGEPVGLIAGSGALPLLVARGARAAGRSVVCVGIHGCFDPGLPALCDRFDPAGDSLAGLPLARPLLLALLAVLVLEQLAASAASYHAAPVRRR